MRQASEGRSSAAPVPIVSDRRVAPPVLSPGDRMKPAKGATLAGTVHAKLDGQVKRKGRVTWDMASAERGFVGRRVAPPRPCFHLGRTHESRRKVRRLPAPACCLRISDYTDAMTSLADLERITTKLDQAYAIMAFSESDAVLAAVRILLRQIRSDDMPSRATRAQWTQIEETMLRLGTAAVTSDKVRGLGEEVHHLREAIVQHLSHFAY